MKNESAIVLKILKKNKINYDLKKKILKLKNQHFKFSIKSQSKWFKKHIKNKDLHNLLFIKNKLIGYNCLRKMRLSNFTKKNKISKNIFWFDTLVVDKKYKGLGLSKKIMLSSNKIILKNKNSGILFCKKNMIRYYKKFNWKVLNSSKIKRNKYLRLNPMVFNFNKKLKNQMFTCNI